MSFPTPEVTKYARSSRPDQGQLDPNQSRPYTIVEVRSEEEVNYDPVEDPENWACEAFAKRSRRMAFVRRVLGTVGLQLGFCSLLTSLLLFSSAEVYSWASKFWWLGTVGLGVWFGINIAVACCNVGRGPPAFFNVTLLVIATLSLSILCAFITSRYREETEIVLYALSTTVAILLVLVIITTFTKIDITGWHMYLAIAGLFLVIGSLVVSILFAFGVIPNDTRHLIGAGFSFLFALLLCFYILWDLQVIIGGRRFQLEEDDWLFACLKLFGDIVIMFLQLLGVYRYVNNN